MRKNKQGGVALVEFALILPFLLVLTFTTTEFGRALYEYQAISKSVRVAARYLATQNVGTHQAEAANLIVYGTIQPGQGARPLLRNLTMANVMAPQWDQAGATPIINTVRVGVTGYQFRSMFTTAFGVIFPPIVFSDITATMRSAFGPPPAPAP
ncbi:TadE/TadG family type IV pilus assembly protein [Ramlibacter algicola]|uniref:Pilus assembly protein n=1 Tax=Ramlibacter algicola TaxID=2795217 RepID=A0A934Q0W4_9BURK|nr:TadE/TadG family type IV pilus assembly protein [Ramlibacter algicola]MBK0394009.1 pilus assembly protein [Ramlibacter algicola]